MSVIKARWIPVSGAFGIGLVCAASLVACGSSGHSASAGANTTATSTASPTASGGRGGFGAEFADPKVQQCLKAAGITIPTATRSLRPGTSGQPRPSFTGTRPSGARPSGSRGAGGVFGGQNGAQIQAALKACGIAVPTFSRPASGTGGQPPVSAAPGS